MLRMLTFPLSNRGSMRRWLCTLTLVTFYSRLLANALRHHATATTPTSRGRTAHLVVLLAAALIIVMRESAIIPLFMGSWAFEGPTLCLFSRLTLCSQSVK